MKQYIKHKGKIYKRPCIVGEREYKLLEVKVSNLRMKINGKDYHYERYILNGIAYPKRQALRMVKEVTEDEFNNLGVIEI